MFPPSSSFFCGLPAYLRVSRNLHQPKVSRFSLPYLNSLSLKSSETMSAITRRVTPTVTSPLNPVIRKFLSRALCWVYPRRLRLRRSMFLLRLPRRALVCVFCLSQFSMCRNPISSTRQSQHWVERGSAYRSNTGNPSYPGLPLARVCPRGLYSQSTCHRIGVITLYSIFPKTRQLRLYSRFTVNIRFSYGNRQQSGVGSPSRTISGSEVMLNSHTTYSRIGGF